MAHSGEQLNAAMQRAVSLHQSGQLAKADRAYAEILQQAPLFADALHLRGVVLSQLGRHDEAIASLRAALLHQPGNPVFQHNLGRALHAINDLDGACAQYLAALQANPAFTEARFNLANALKALGRVQQAETLYREIIRNQPRHAAAHYNLGNLLLEQGRFKSARGCFEEAVRLNPAHAEAHNNLGIALQEFAHEQEALASYQRALQLKPEFTDAVRNMAGLYARQGRDDEAQPLYRRLLELDPGDDLLRLSLDSHCPVIAQSNAQIDEYRARLDAALDRYLERGIKVNIARIGHSGGEPPFHIGYHGRDERPLKEKFGKLFSGRLPQIEHAPRSGKPHVGIVVTHGHEGVFMKCMRGVIRRLPQKHFRLSVVCSYEPGAELLRNAIENPDVKFVVLPGRFEQVLERLREARFDLLYYWEVGTDATNYFLPYCRPAPIQCAGWGWPVTSGIPQMDYFLSCAQLEPEGYAAHYTERVVLLPTLPTYYFRPPVPEGPARKPRAHFGLSEDDHVYLCLQNLRKVHPDMDPLFARILREDPQGVLLVMVDLQPAITEQLRRRMQRNLPDVMERVRFLPRIPEADYLSLVAQADVVLDTLHYTGGANTTCDVFAAGTPIVTLPTAFHRGRYTAAAYRLMGVTDCIAAGADDYVRIALRLGADRAVRADMSRRLQETCQVLFEDQAAVNDLAACFGELLGRRG